MAGDASAVHPFGAGLYPKAQVLNRFIAKLIDLFIVAAAAELVDPVGFLAGLAYLLVADGFARRGTQYREAADRSPNDRAGCA